jgi:hypothetical protein
VLKQLQIKSVFQNRKKGIRITMKNKARMLSRQKGLDDFASSRALKTSDSEIGAKETNSEDDERKSKTPGQGSTIRLPATSN